MNADLQQLQRELDSSLEGLGSDQTQLRPVARPACWSIQQIVEHLLLTYELTGTALEARIAKRAPTRARPTLVQQFSQYALLGLGYFPSGRKAPAPVTPLARSIPRSGEQLSVAVDEHLAGLGNVCRQAEEIFGANHRFASHMILGPMNVNQWRRFQLIHGHHHVKQILAIRQAYQIAPSQAAMHQSSH